MTDKRDESTWIDLLDEPAVRDSSFCLCGRDPVSADVREELVKATALSLRYGLVLGGCLGDAAAAFDEIIASLQPNETRKLERLKQDINDMLEGSTVEPAFSEESKPEGAWLH